MVAFRNSDPSGRTSGLLLRCVLYSLLALGLIIVDKRYDHLGKIRRWLSIVAYPVEVAVESPLQDGTGSAKASARATRCAMTMPGSRRICAWRNSSCSAMRPSSPKR